MGSSQSVRDSTRRSAKSHLTGSGRHNIKEAQVSTLKGIGYALLYIGDVLADQDPRTRSNRGPEGMEEKSSPMGDMP